MNDSFFEQNKKLNILGFIYTNTSTSSKNSIVIITKLKKRDKTPVFKPKTILN
jgi:hypothetical protein